MASLNTSNLGSFCSRERLWETYIRAHKVKHKDERVIREIWEVKDTSGNLKQRDSLRQQHSGSERQTVGSAIRVVF